jgi:hypothetical protein
MNEYLSWGGLNDHSIMSQVCVECRQCMEATAKLAVRECACPVHSECWVERLQMSICSGVVQIRCSKCWAVLWMGVGVDEEDDNDRPMKRNRK